MTQNDEPGGIRHGFLDMEHKTKLSQHLINRGYLLELQVYNILGNSGWDVWWNKTYWEIAPDYVLDMCMSSKDATKLSMDQLRSPQREMRTIDIVARKSTSVGLDSIKEFTVNLVIECKFRQRENWVFHMIPVDNSLYDINYSEEAAYISLFEESSTLFLEQIQRFSSTNEDHKRIQRASHHSWKNQRRVAATGLSAFSPEKINNVQNACDQVLGAFFYNVNWDQWRTLNGVIYGDDRHWRTYPVIVFDGPLCEVEIGTDGTPDFKELKWLSMLASHYTYTGIVDIVNWQYINEYLGVLEQELEEIKSLG